MAPQMDTVLHQERIERRRKRLHALTSAVSELPDGAVIAADGAAYTLVGGMSFRWTEGNRPNPYLICRLPDGVLTLLFNVAAIKAGYRRLISPFHEISINT